MPDCSQVLEYNPAKTYLRFQHSRTIPMRHIVYAPSTIGQHVVCFHTHFLALLHFEMAQHEYVGYDGRNPFGKENEKQNFMTHLPVS